jgi:hypothetical protein
MALSKRFQINRKEDKSKINTKVEKAPVTNADAKALATTLYALFKTPMEGGKLLDPVSNAELTVQPMSWVFKVALETSIAEVFENKTAYLKSGGAIDEDSVKRLVETNMGLIYEIIDNVVSLKKDYETDLIGIIKK